MAKENVIKTKIALDGEKEYKQACKSIDLSLKEIGSEMKLVTETFGRNAKSTDALKSKQEVLKKQFEEQSKKAKEAESALKAMRESGVDPASAAYVQMKTSLNNANAEMAKTERQINDIDNALKGHSIQWDKIGGAVGKSLKVMGSALATLGTAAVGAASAMAALTVSAGKYADDILTMSANTHIATDDLQKYQYALNFIDGDIDTLTKTLKKNTQQMDAARDGNKELMAAYDALGISITDSNGELRNGQDVYWEVIDALGQVENMTERDALAMQLLGKSGTELNTIIDAGSEEFKKLGAEAEAMGVVMGEQSLNKLGAFDDKMQQIKAGLGGLKNSLGFVALPFLDALATQGIPILAEFSKGMQEAEGDITKMGEVFGDGLSGIIDLLVDQLPKFFDFGTQIISSIVRGLSKNAGNIAKSGLEILGTLVKGLSDILPQILSGGANIIKELGAGLGKELPNLIPQVVKIITEVVQTLVDNIPQVISAGTDILEGLIKGIIDAIPILVEALPQIITSIVDTLLGAIPQIIDAGVSLLESLVSDLPDIIDTIVEAIPKIIEGIIKAFSENIPKIIDSGVKLLTSLIENLPTIILTIVEAIPKIIDGIVTAITDNIDTIITAGVDMIVALVKNLPAALLELVKKGPEIVGAIVDGVMNAIGSIVDLGAKIVEKIWEGITNMMSWLWEQFTGWINGLVDWAVGMFNGIAEDVEERRELTSNPEAWKRRTGPYSPKDESAGDAGTTVNVTQNIYADNTSYSEQQKEAAKHIKNTVRGLWK